MAEYIAPIVIDMLNRYEHEDADALSGCVRESLPAIQTMIEHAQAAWEFWSTLLSPIQASVYVSGHG